MKAKMTKKPVAFDKAIPHMISVIDSQDREDIPYYLAMLIADHFDKRVLVLDNTAHGLLYDAIPAAEGMELKEQGNVAFLRSIALSEEFFQRFDCIIVMHGSKIDRDLFLASGYYLVLTGYRPYALTELVCSQDWKDPTDASAVLKEDNSCIFFLDKVTEKVSAKQIIKKANLSGKEIPFVELALDEKDYICQMNLLYNGHQGPGGVSRELMSALTGVLSLITDIPAAQLKHNRR